MDKEKIEDKARSLALLNAVRYKGKCNPKSLIGPIIAGFPDSRKDMKTLMSIIDSVTEQINSMSLKEQEEEIENKGIEAEKKNKRRDGLPGLKDAVKGKVVMRFEPSPSGPLHIGHNFSLLLNSEYVKMYDGKLILRISDTNAKNTVKEAYSMIEEDAKWITGDIDKPIIQSERLDIYYRHMETLIKKGHAYVCTCRPEDFRELVNSKKPCPCRSLSSEENLSRWEDMFKREIYSEGDAVVRIKTDIKHKNPAIREWPAFRINDDEHPLTKKRYRVWPLMNFSVAVDDHELGLTHVIRGKDHITNTVRQGYLYDYMGWDMPEFIHIGRVNFEGFELSTSKTRKKIEDGIYDGWDDTRLPFLRALKRRGFQPEAFKRLVREIGPSKNDKTMSIDDFFKTVERYNKDIIDKISIRLFFVEDPKKVTIPKDMQKEVEIDNHPTEDMGLRKIRPGKHIFVSGTDMKRLKDKEVRLRKLSDGILNTVFKPSETRSPAVIQWVPEKAIEAEILMPDGTTMKGLAEPEAKSLKPGDIIQFERFGFARCDSKDPLRFCFAHK